MQPTGEIMSDAQSRFVVITGGPGSGKSTLIEALERAGQRASEEVGRRIIQAQRAIAGRALPWVDPALFAEMMLSWEMQSRSGPRLQPPRSVRSAEISQSRN
jgi:predicted ATPase